MTDRTSVEAAIAALYAQAPSFEETDWPQAVQLYDRLLDLWPSPVVALNRTVPLSYAPGPAAALAEVEALEHDERLAGYPYLLDVAGRCAGRRRYPEDVWGG